jgi:hypothetical protein
MYLHWPSVDIAAKDKYHVQQELFQLSSTNKSRAPSNASQSAVPRTTPTTVKRGQEGHGEAQYELYVFVAEANGQAIPFAFLFTVLTGDSAEGAQTRMLSDIAKFINKRCPKIMFTLSDKEPAEITACRTEIPQAKHQLCYWHTINYIEERLGKNKPPAPYGPRKAYKIFDFIDPTWVPGEAYCCIC